MTTKTLLPEISTEQLEALLAERKQQEATDKKQKRHAYEDLRNATVVSMINEASAFSNSLKVFKSKVFSDLEVMYKLLQEHSDRHADGKGNFTLETSDRLMQVAFRRQDNTRFDERATQAEKHILDFLTTQFGDSAPTSKLVRKLLERKKGQLEKDEVLRLISMKDDFDNENWKKGIELLQESIVPGDTRYYVQFKIKLSDGAEWTPILLDFAKL